MRSTLPSRRAALAFLTVLGTCGAFAACGDDDPIEEAGDTVEDAADDAGDAIEDAAEEVDGN